MPPPDPLCLSDVLDGLIKGGPSAEGDARSNAVSTLFSIAHCREVQEAFLNNHEAVAVLARYTGDITKHAHTVRWEALATIGELCRREHQQAPSPVSPQNARAEALAALFVQQPHLQGSLEAAAGGADEGVAGVASDLLAALPFPAVTGWKTKAKDLLYLDPRLMKPWPRVCRASRTSGCLSCGGGDASSMMKCARCKSVFYCSQACATSHWKAGHKARCKLFAAKDADDPLSNESGLFFPTRPQLYASRPKSMQAVPYDSFFFEYAQPVPVTPKDLLPPG